MTFDLLGDLDWLAVLGAAIAYFVLGAVWYAPPILGRIWMEAGGATMGGPSTNGSSGTGSGGPGPAIYAVPLVGAVLASIALGMLALATGTSGASEGLALGLVVAIGFAIPVCVVTATFETKKPRPFVWGAVNAGYHGVGVVLAALIIALMA
ncbi:MAG TPA: DUF1761 domain-containing protein [Actinomycetota bacterium]